MSVEEHGCGENDEEYQYEGESFAIVKGFHVKNRTKTKQYGREILFHCHFTWKGEEIAHF